MFQSYHFLRYFPSQTYRRVAYIFPCFFIYIPTVTPHAECPILARFIVTSNFRTPLVSIGNGYVAAKSLGDDFVVMDDSLAMLFLDVSGLLSVDLSRRLFDGFVAEMSNKLTKEKKAAHCFLLWKPET